MKTKIIAVLATIAILASVLLTGCTGDETTGDNTQAQLDSIKTRLVAIEQNIGQLDLSVQNTDVLWCKAQITDIKNQLAGITNPTNFQPQINALQTSITNLEAQIEDLQAQIDDLEAAIDEGGYIESLFVTASLSVDSVILHINSPDVAIVVFEVTFHTTELYPVGSPGDTINDVIKALYTDSPAGCRAGLITLRPEFSVRYNPDDDTWYLERVIFVTQGTTIPAGESEKAVTVTDDTFGDYVTASVRVIAETGSTPSW